MAKEKKYHSRPLMLCSRRRQGQRFVYLIRKKKAIPVHAPRLARAYFSERKMCFHHLRFFTSSKPYSNFDACHVS